MGLRVIGDLDDLERDLRTITRKAKTQLPATVLRNARRGNTIGRRLARESAGAHGKHYWKAWSAERHSPLIADYGPDAAHPDGQGDMSFNDGSRNQPAHNDLEKSQDVIGPAFAADVARQAGSWFWP